MDYARAPIADRLAAEYVLGTLRGPARRRFEALLPAHPSLRAAVSRWQHWLEPMAASVSPVEPATATWQHIEARLFPPPGSAPAAAEVRGASAPWWQRLGAWRLLTGVAGAAALSLAVMLVLPRPVLPPIVVVLAPSDAAAALPALQQARFVASIGGDGRSLVLRPLQAVPLDAQRALELWAVPADGSPRSLGLISSEAATTVLRTHLLDNTAAFAISVEPAGGSPTGTPTGPVVSVGKLQI